MDTCGQGNTVNLSSYGLDVERRPDGLRRRLDYVLHLFSKLDRCPPYHSRVVSHQQVEALQRPRRSVKVYGPVTAKSSIIVIEVITEQTYSAVLCHCLCLCIRCGRVWVPQESSCRTTPPLSMTCLAASVTRSLMYFWWSVEHAG